MESEGKRGDSSWKGLKFLSRKEQPWLNTAAQLWNFPLPSAWKFSPTCTGITWFIRWMNAIVFFKTVFWFLAKNVFMSIEPSIVKKKKKKVIIIRSCFKKIKLSKREFNTCQCSKHKASTMIAKDKSCFFTIKRFCKKK